MVVRSGYSFRRAFGHLEDVHKRVIECGYPVAVIADTATTFNFVKWHKLCKKANIKPVFGAEIAVADELTEKKPALDYWTFLARDSIRPLNELITKATRGPLKEPALTYEQATSATGVFKIAGHAARLDKFSVNDDLYIGLSPAVSKGFFNAAKKLGHKFIARSDNFYPREEDQELYRVALGFRSSTQTYPQHILTDAEYRAALKYTATDLDLDYALLNRAYVLEHCNADLVKAQLLKPERHKSLREMCVEGAAERGCDLSNEVYGARLDRELTLIAEKNFEDYFYILADMINWAKRRMVVGPARGSSCGSLVCYLLGITAIDPIPYGLIFERFIDINRKDLPDIDVDFSDVRRDMVFEYAERKYGADHVARLGTVGLFRPRSALNQVGASLQIPNWMIERTLESVTERSSGDSRAMLALEDAMMTSDAGKALIREYPKALMAAKMEGHPNNSSQHAAGIVITEQPLIEYIGVDARSNSAMCDKKDAEELNLLKIDALGLTQLSIFERTLQLIGKPDVSGYLETIPLDDPAAFAVLNEGRFSGIFQFTGQALKSLTKQVKIDKLDDMVAITALARPGPMATGGANTWARRRMGLEPVTYLTPQLEELTKDTFGVMIYQEQIMTIVKTVGNLSWEDTSSIRKAMSGRLGDEYFSGYKAKFIDGSIQSGLSVELAEELWRSICTFGSWCVSGSTRLVNPHSNQFDKKIVTIKELYKFKNKNQALYCLQGDVIKPARISNVTYSGKKETWCVIVDSGEKIRTTEEHCFLCSDEKYRKLKHLRVGSEVMMQGDTAPTKRKTKKRTGSGGHNWGHKLKAGLPLYKRQVARLKKIYKKCQNCKKKPYQETHHLDGDHENHIWENLLPVCRSCHRSLHGVSIPHSRGKSPRVARIVSISSPRIEDVYDISMPPPFHNFVAENFIVHNSFNKSHAVAYGFVSYWTCFLKAHHPYEFAAATLDAESDPLKQIATLRELAAEGIGYIPVDADHSTDRWSFRKDAEGKRTLIGPVSMIKGIGPKMTQEIMDARRNNTPIRAALQKRLDNGVTPIDTLFPIRDAIAKIYPDITLPAPDGPNIISPITPLNEVQCGIDGEVTVLVVMKKIAPRDENDAQNVVKRQQRAAEKGNKYASGKLDGPTQALNMFIADDTDEIFCKIDRYNFDALGRDIIEHGKPGKALYAIKGTVPRDFRMISVKRIKLLGDI